MPVCARGSLQRVLEAEENGDGCQDDEEFELDAPKRKNRNRNKVSTPIFDAFVRAELRAGTRGGPTRLGASVGASGEERAFGSPGCCLLEPRIQPQKNRSRQR